MAGAPPPDPWWLEMLIAVLIPPTLAIGVVAFLAARRDRPTVVAAGSVALVSVWAVVFGLSALSRR